MKGFGFRDMGLGLRELRELRDPGLLKGILTGVHKGSIKGLVFFLKGLFLFRRWSREPRLRQAFGKPTLSHFFGV